MGEENITRVIRLSDGPFVEIMPDGSQRPLEGTTDWTRLENMTEEEVITAALADSDCPPLKEEELKQFRRRNVQSRAED